MEPRLLGSTARCAAHTMRIGAPSKVARSAFAAMKPPMAPSSEQATSEGAWDPPTGSPRASPARSDASPARTRAGERHGQQLGDARQVASLSRRTDVMDRRIVDRQRR